MDKMNKQQLLNDILDWYDIKNSGDTIENQLVYLLPTLLESNQCHENEGLGSYYLWKKEEIDFIRSLTR